MADDFPTPPPALNASSARRRSLGTWALIFAVTLLAYAPVFRGGLLMDDDEHITRAALRPVHGLERIWFEAGATAQYYPLLNTAFWVEHRLWGDALLGYHLMNILQHALAACLVVAIARRLALPGALLAGLIFALHPVGVDTVAWISEQKNTLSTVLGLGAALAYLNFDRDRGTGQYAVALGLFVLALFTKTVTATLPPALLVVFWWQRGRLGWRRDVVPLLPWFALGAGAGLFTAWFEQKFSGAHGPDFALPLLARVLVAGRAIWFYLGTLLWPADLLFINPRWTPDLAAGWQYLFPLGIVAVTAGLALLARRHRGPLAAFLIFTGTLFPALGFLNINWFIFSYVADHFQYLACLGLIVPAAAMLAAAARRIPDPIRWLGPVAGGALVVLLGALTWQHSHVYRNAETLYRATLARNPACWLAHNNLGAILEKTPGGLNEAISHYEAAVRLKPDHARAYSNLGNALAQAPGRLPDALAAYEMALRFQPELAVAHTNLANTLARIPGRLPEAIAQHQIALRLQPDSAEAHYDLGRALAGAPGHLPDAIAEYGAALRLKPDYLEAHNSLGNALADTPGRVAEAVTEYQAALRLQPDHAGVHANLGSVLATLPGRLPEAIAEYQAVVRLKPDDPEAHHNLGALLLESPDGTAEAVIQFEAVVRIQPDSAEAHYNLGQALLTQPGRRTEALQHFEAALRLRPDLEPAREMVRRLRAGP